MENGVEWRMAWNGEWAIIKWAGWRVGFNKMG